MRKNFIYIALAMLLFSCYSSDKRPAGIIRPDSMKSILWDVLRAQTYADEIGRKDSSVNKAALTTSLSQKIFKIHHTDSAHFNESYNWYIKHPDVLKLIFDSLYVQKQRENNLKFQKKNLGNHSVPVK